MPVRDRETDGRAQHVMRPTYYAELQKKTSFQKTPTWCFLRSIGLHVSIVFTDF